MIRRPLWNRGGGVFVEETTWSTQRGVAVAVADEEPVAGGAIATLAAADEPDDTAAEARAAADASPARWVHVRIVTER